MKYLNKLLAALFLFAGMSSILADDNMLGSFVLGNNGTASATVIIPAAPGYANVTDLTWTLDANLTSGAVDIRPAKSRYLVTSATSASGTQLWFGNTGTAVAAGNYMIYFNASAGTYTLVRASAAATTSITLETSLTPATTVNDVVWSTQGTFRRSTPNTTSSAQPAVNIWCPEDAPTAFTIDGNTTACKIQVGGLRSKYRN